MDTPSDPRIRLPFQTLVTHRGKLFRITSIPLNSGRGKPGIGRISYHLEPAAISSDGKPIWGIFVWKHYVRADSLTIVSPETTTFDRKMGHTAR